MSASNLQLRIGYISGPMRGYADFNYPAFNLAAKLWREKGFIIHNPAENFSGIQYLALADYLRRDLMMVIDSDFIVMLPSWEASQGAYLEFVLARTLKKPVILQTELEEVPDELGLREHLLLRYGNAPYWSGRGDS